MDVFEFSTVSFLVKIWIEELTEEPNCRTWRGHITHVPDGKRRYFSSLNELHEFIGRYLKEMGIKTTFTVSNDG
jgi:hypothetical protein